MFIYVTFIQSVYRMIIYKQGIEDNGLSWVGFPFCNVCFKKTVTIYSCDTVLWIFFETDIKIKMLPCKAL